MIKQIVEYKDYNGEDRKEELYFNLTEAEVVEMQYSEKGGIVSYLRKILIEKDEGKVLKYFKDLLITGYGEKSPDGKYFIKDEETKKHLIYSPAYSQLFMKFARDSKAGFEFIRGMIPEEYASQLNNDALDDTKTFDPIAMEYVDKSNAGDDANAKIEDTKK